MSGTKIGNFEVHLAEVMWRNFMKKKNIYEAFSELDQEFYPRDTDMESQKRHFHLFDMWTHDANDATEVTNEMGERSTILNKNYDLF